MQLADAAHKDLFPMTGYECVGTFLIFLGLVIAAYGGIGGGGIIVPVLLLVFGFDSQHAIPLSNITVFGSSIVNMAFNAARRYPSAHLNRPLIDWDAVLMMEPLTMIGAIVGALINRLLPDWLVLSTLDVILIVGAYQLIHKGLRDCQLEGWTTALPPEVSAVVGDTAIEGSINMVIDSVDSGQRDVEEAARTSNGQRGTDNMLRAGSAEEPEVAGESKRTTLLPILHRKIEQEKTSYVSPDTRGRIRMRLRAKLLGSNEWGAGGGYGYGSIVSDDSTYEGDYNDNDRDDDSALCSPEPSPGYSLDSDERFYNKAKATRTSITGTTSPATQAIFGSSDATNYSMGESKESYASASTSFSSSFSERSDFYLSKHGTLYRTDKPCNQCRLLPNINSKGVKLIWITLLFLVIISLNLAKCEGGERMYWGLNGAILLWVLCSTLFAGVLLHSTWKQRTESGARHPEPLAPSPSQDIQWSLKNTICCPLLCIFAGLFTGIWGVGGGFIKGPLLLFLNMRPVAAAATSATMIFFTSLVATTSYFAFGTIVWDYSLYFFVLGMLSTTVGQTLGPYLISQKNRSSVVSLSMGCVLAISGVLMTTETMERNYLRQRDFLSERVRFPPPFRELCK